MLPYLHERKVYLNQIELTHRWFYNIVAEGDTGESENLDDETKRNYLFAYNFSKFEFDVYTEKGIQVRHNNFKKQVKNYGVPIQVSHDGRNFIFQ